MRRQAITERFLTVLEEIVHRYRPASARPELAEVCADVITAEVAHHLGLTRAALHRSPPLVAPGPIHGRLGLVTETGDQPGP
ncbi:MAG TPA: hypothetical protein VE196_04115 [Pseudonocardiaceae bacterium]|nr:hypothetical protein [Pseudonocardiaceae bacterium]